MIDLDDFVRVYTELHGHEPTDWQRRIGEALMRGERVQLVGPSRSSQKRQAQAAYDAFGELLKRPEFVSPQVIADSDNE